MRKIIIFNMLSLDGFVAGPGGDIYWHRVDDEFNEFAIEQLSSVGGLIFGRVTYQLMADYWPSPAALKDDPIIAGLMNALPKIVTSRTLDKAEWSNTRLVKNNIAEECFRLKQQPGADLFIFGSADLSATLIEKNLIDEYRFIVNPLVLGSGLPQFKSAGRQLPLKFASVRTFGNGNVLLIYRPDQNEA